MDENDKTISYKQVSSFSKEQHNFGKSIILPFISGILGSILAIGICFSIPSIKNKLIESGQDFTSPTSSTNLSNPNTDLVSLVDYSDTSVGVAKKVLPSIVGIQVEYKVNSIFNTRVFWFC